MTDNRREKIKMNPNEVLGFIEGQQNLQVASLGADGWPHLTTLWFSLLESRVVFGTYTRSQKIVNLKRDPRITVLVEDGKIYEELRGVMIKGKAILENKPDQVRHCALEIMKRNQLGVADNDLKDIAEQWAAKRTIVIVEPVETISWDHTKLSDSR